MLFGKNGGSLSKLNSEVQIYHALSLLYRIHVDILHWFFLRYMVFTEMLKTRRVKGDFYRAARSFDGKFGDGAFVVGFYGCRDLETNLFSW